MLLLIVVQVASGQLYAASKKKSPKRLVTRTCAFAVKPFYTIKAREKILA